MSAKYKKHPKETSTTSIVGLKSGAESGLKIRRLFSTAGEDPLNSVEWEFRSAVIRSDSGKIIFERNNIETPASWSDLALNVVASRYFRGLPGSPDRENSVKRLITRVVDTIGEWGWEQGYFVDHEDSRAFRDELAFILVNQKASFNSPVWFNVGVEPEPQCSACFILNVDDTMESILKWYTNEGLIFKGGSGSGVNISRLRSCREPLAGGGTASGPVSFMKAADHSAGVIKSGGKTRRAAKMVILDVDHPDIMQFIKCKSQEEDKVSALISAGYEASFEGDAYSTVAFQNSNHSVRVGDDFMDAVNNDESWNTKFVLSGQTADTYKAKEILREIAEAAHRCGDPGIQFHSTINRLHTCPETGPIRASNPCSEFMHIDNSACNLASLRLTAFPDNETDFDVTAFKHAIDIMITAQDILVERSSYPTSEIRDNSHKMRALGLGYADLGAFLMSKALSYDSDTARCWASVITSIMTGEAYLQSARIASFRGPFSEFGRNRSAMLDVVKMHLNDVLEIGNEHVTRRPGWRGSTNLVASP